jgi:hypothetical protein
MGTAVGAASKAVQSWEQKAVGQVTGRPHRMQFVDDIVTSLSGIS